MKSLTFRHSANFTQQRFFSERNRAFSKVYKRSFCRNTLAGSCLFKSCQKMSQFQVRVDRGWTWLDCEKKAETLPVVVLKNLARVFLSFFAVNVETMEQLFLFYSCLFFAVLSSGSGLALDGYDSLCPKNDLAFITSEVRRCEQVGRDWPLLRWALEPPLGVLTIVLVFDRVMRTVTAVAVS